MHPTKYVGQQLVPMPVPCLCLILSVLHLNRNIFLLEKCRVLEWVLWLTCIFT